MFIPELRYLSWIHLTAPAFLFQSGSSNQGGIDPAEVDKLVNDLAQAQENSKRSQEEMERLLKLVQMSQEEQNTKEKQIHDLQM